MNGPAVIRILGLCSALVATNLVAGCASINDVSVLASDTVPARAGSTFAWAPASAGSNQDLRVANDIIEHRIRRAIELALADIGFRQVADPTRAGLTVAHYATVQDVQETRVETWTSPRLRWGFSGAPRFDAYTVDYTEGALLIDITDRPSSQLAWRAPSRKQVDRNDASQEAINAVVADMTRSLPGSAD